MLELHFEAFQMPRDKVKYPWTYFARLLGALLLLGYLIYSVGLPSLLAILMKLNPLGGAATLISSIAFIFLGGINIWLLMRVMRPISFAKFMQSYNYSYAVNLFMPGQLGDASLTLFLKRQGIPYSQSTVAYSIDKFVTAIILFSVGWFGAKILLPGLNPIWFIILPLAGISGIIIIGSAIWLIPCKCKVFGKCKIFPRLRNLLANALIELAVFRKKWYMLFLNFALTVVKWLVMSLTFYLGFYSLGVKVGWPEIGVIPVLSTLIGYIPISIGGIGTVECFAIYLFSMIAVDKVHVLGVYLFLRSIIYFLALIIFASIWKTADDLPK